MAAFTKFESFVGALAHGIHDFSSDQITVALCNAANPPLVADDQLVDLTTITPYTNLSARTVTTTSSAETGGTYKLTLTDLVLTATGAVAAFQYVALYNEDAAGDELIGFYNYGSEVTLANGETFTINFDDANGVLTVA